METRKPSLIVIVGPNASGKSELAVRLARKFDGEIVSADSRQVYRGLDIGTGKVPGVWQGAGGKRRFWYRGIPHHCIDFVSLRRTFSVTEYQHCATSAIADVHRRGKLPLLVGGTAFWIDAVAYSIRLPAVPPNIKLRHALAGKSAKDLFAILQRLDPERARTVEPKNPRRIIRAIEIAKATGRTPKVERRMPYRLLWLGVSLPPKILQQRIHERLLKRLRRGMLAEAEKLRASGLRWKRFYELGLEYRFLANHLRGRSTREQMIAGLERAIRHYARRQMRWWQRNKNIRWLRRPADAEQLVRGFTPLQPGRPTLQAPLERYFLTGQGGGKGESKTLMGGPGR